MQNAVGARVYTLMGDVLIRSPLGAEKTARRSERRKRVEFAIAVVVQFDHAHYARLTLRIDNSFQMEQE